MRCEPQGSQLLHLSLVPTGRHPLPRRERGWNGHCWRVTPGYTAVLTGGVALAACCRRVTSASLPAAWGCFGASARTFWKAVIASGNCPAASNEFPWAKVLRTTSSWDAPADEAGAAKACRRSRRLQTIPAMHNPMTTRMITLPISVCFLSDPTPCGVNHGSEPIHPAMTQRLGSPMNSHLLSMSFVRLPLLVNLTIIGYLTIFVNQTLCLGHRQADAAQGQAQRPARGAASRGG